MLCSKHIWNSNKRMFFLRVKLIFLYSNRIIILFRFRHSEAIPRAFAFTLRVIRGLRTTGLNTEELLQITKEM